MNREHNDRANREFSDEFLNAFLDNQLTPEEKDRAYLRISQDETLNRRVCELRKIQDMVRLAYQHTPDAPARPRPGRNHDRYRLGLAAGVALAVGVALGWVLHQPEPVSAPVSVTPSTVATAAPADDVDTAPASNRRPVTPVAIAKVPTESAAASKAPATEKPVAAETALLAPLPGGDMALTAAEEKNIVSVPYTPGPVTGDTVKVLVHISTARAARNTETLDEIENLVRHYRKQQQSARIEVVMNGDGLSLVRADVTRFAERIRRMQQDYDNLTFAACQNTILRLKREQGLVARLLPGVTVIDSGVAQIMRRQQQGWAYIQV